MKLYSVREALPQEASENLKAYPELVRSLLYYRGITDAEKAQEFLNPSYETGLHDPYLMKDMDKAVKRILAAIENNERILIYSDYDADGIPAAVVMHDFFKLIGYENFEVYIPHRHNEGYGLHLEAIDTFKDRVKLMITLDCGIVDCDEVKHASDSGIDVIVTDHHVPGLKLPKAIAVVNAHQKKCEYPFDYLCGSGVAFKLVQALLIKLREKEFRRSASLMETSERGGAKLEENFSKNLSVLQQVRAEKEIPKIGQEKWLLDMVGLATLSDMVPLQGENRVLAHYGLKVLKKTRRPGLQKLLAKLKINPKYLTEDDIGFMITPRINAASRMGIPTDAFELLSTADEGVAGKFADHLDQINNERKGLVASTVKEVKKLLAERADHYESQKIIVIGNPNWRPALLGLVANTLVDQYSKPVFLWGREEEKDIKGSCRSDGSVHLVELMEASKHVFKEFGGHTMSGGYALNHEYVHTLEEELTKAYEKVKKNKTVEEKITADAHLTLDDVNERLFKHIDQFAPFGVGNPKPQFIFEQVKIEELKMFGKTQEHLELTFINSAGRKIKAIGFFMMPQDFPLEPKKGDTINLLATLEKSYFRNFPELRLRIVDIL
jgi:single-stranded-DNA-specific exonuclease